MLWDSILELILGPINTALETRKTKKEAEAKVLVAKTEAQAAAYQKVVEGTLTWEQAAVEAKKTSWLDEFVTVTVFAPYIFSFIPLLQPYAKGAIEFVTLAPPWYQWLFMAVASAAVGIKIGRNALDMFKK